MAQDTWTPRELPVLDWLVQYFDEPDARVILLTDIASAMGWEEADMTRALARLAKARPGYITWPDIAETDVPQYVSGVTERALTATRAWPTAESLADRLVARLEEEADGEPDPDKKSRLRETARFLGGAARDVVVDVTATFAARAAGM